MVPQTFMFSFFSPFFGSFPQHLHIAPYYLHLALSPTIDGLALHFKVQIQLHANNTWDMQNSVFSLLMRMIWLMIVLLILFLFLFSLSVSRNSPTWHLLELVSLRLRAFLSWLTSFKCILLRYQNPRCRFLCNLKRIGLRWGILFLKTLVGQSLQFAPFWDW